LDAPLLTAGALQPGAVLDWLSPRAADDWAEYRDAAFLERIGRPDLAPKLRAFWPHRGPQWDALARAHEGDTIVLVEGKAHARELISSCAAKSDRSRAKIAAALDLARNAVGAAPTADWLNGYYQYANRLAHLYFLRREGVPAHLLSIYFCGDSKVKGPATEAEWSAHLAQLRRHLGIALDRTIPGLVDVFISIQDLNDVR
jgi:hypothetical protein